MQRRRCLPPQAGCSRSTRPGHRTCARAADTPEILSRKRGRAPAAGLSADRASAIPLRRRCARRGHPCRGIRAGKRQLPDASAETQRRERLARALRKTPPQASGASRGPRFDRGKAPSPPTLTKARGSPGRPPRRRLERPRPSAPKRLGTRAFARGKQRETALCPQRWERAAESRFRGCCQTPRSRAGGLRRAVRRAARHVSRRAARRIARRAQRGKARTRSSPCALRRAHSLPR